MIVLIKLFSYWLAGKNVKSGKIVKITGLDPAHPLYSMSRPNERLDTTDAIYVETLHTSKLGFSRILGHVRYLHSTQDSVPISQLSY